MQTTSRRFAARPALWRAASPYGLALCALLQGRPRGFGVPPAAVTGPGTEPWRDHDRVGPAASTSSVARPERKAPMTSAAAGLDVSNFWSYGLEDADN